MILRENLRYGAIIGMCHQLYDCSTCLFELNSICGKFGAGQQWKEFCRKKLFIYEMLDILND